MKKLIAVIAIWLFASTGYADPIEGKPILIVGASLGNGIGPKDFPFSTNFGSYCDIGCALQRKDRFVLNGAQGGAATEDYTTTLFGPPISFDGYQKQFEWVTGVAFNFVTGEFNADYLLILMTNDCISGASSPSPCTLAEVNAFLDIQIDVGQQALDFGIIPVFDIYPAYADMNLQGFLDLGIPWVIDEAGWNQMRDLHMTRIAAELPGATQVDMWKDYSHLGDGLHPDVETAEAAGERVNVACPVLL